MDYTPIYDAVRSRITNGDIGQAVQDVLRETNLSWHVDRVQYSAECAITAVQESMTRPSVLFRPALGLDGNQYCALYGSNIQEGLAGFGNTPDLAMLDFDKNWRESVAR